MRVALLCVILTGCETYAVHRAAFVPRAVPIATSGQPTLGAADVSFGATALDPGAPTAGDPEAGLEVPRAQLRGAASVRITRNFSLGLAHEEGLARSAVPVSPTLPPVDGGSVDGSGVTIAYSAPLDDDLRLGLALEAMVWTVPYVEYVTCATCDDAQLSIQRGTTRVPTLAAAITPSYRRGRVTYFGGLTLRNHPTAIAKTYQTDTQDGGDVRTGPANLVIDAGVEVMLVDGLRASLFVHEDLSTLPVDYGAAVGAMITIPLGGPLD